METGFWIVAADALAGLTVTSWATTTGRYRGQDHWAPVVGLATLTTLLLYVAVLGSFPLALFGLRAGQAVTVQMTYVGVIVTFVTSPLVGVLLIVPVIANRTWRPIVSAVLLTPIVGLAGICAWEWLLKANG